MLAEAIGGSTQHFVEMMNEKSKELGLTATNFVNVYGSMASIVKSKVIILVIDAGAKASSAFFSYKTSPVLASINMGRRR